MLAIETLLGALTGYFTNDIAIRQLFAKNGMVVRERERFTTLIVQVLKDKIIDAETMASLCDRPEMVSFFDQFVHAIVNEALPQALLEKCLADFDANGALQGIMKGHIADAEMPQFVLDEALVYEHVASLMQGEAFKEALAQSLQNIGKMSLEDMGVAGVLEDIFSTFEHMDDDAWQAWLEKKKYDIMDALDVTTMNLNDGCSQTVKALLSVDGELLMQKVEAYFAVDFSKPEHLDQFKAHYTAFLEQLYVFAARVLPQIIELHLPALFDVFYPMLQSDRKWLEQMVLESIEACNTDGNMILSVASGYVQKFFAPDADGRDWLEKLFDMRNEPEKISALCTRLADFLCGLIMRQIDEWRRLDVENEAAVQRIEEQYQAGRAMVVKLVNAYLEMPAQGNPVHRILMQGMVSALFVWVRKTISAGDVHDFIGKYKDRLLHCPLEVLFFSEELQGQVAEFLSDWWQREGKTWLSGLDVSEKSLKNILYKTIDMLFNTHVGHFVEYIQGVLPYEQLSDGLRGLFFDHLRDFLAGLTRQQLDALTHEEIREVVLDMIGREMRPLAYLGGGIGALAGVATGAAMQATGISVDQEQLALLLAARSGMYGAVGYGTNVMAVKGLFWPYKKTLGLQGLISKNQTRFANKMKNMAESYIINEDIWMEQVARASERIGLHDDEILRYGLHLMDEHRDETVRSFVEMMSHRLPHQLCRGFFAEPQFAKRMQWLSEQGVQCCLNEGALGKIAARFQWLHHGICKVAMTEAKERTWSNKIVEMLHGVSEEQWVALGNGVLGQLHLPKNVGVYENAWQYVASAYQSLPTRLLAYKEDIAGGLDRYISKKLAFPLQLAYRMAGGERQIERVVAYFIEHQLPRYLSGREAQVEFRLTKWAITAFAGRSLVECGVTLSGAQGQCLAEWSRGLRADDIHQHVLALLAYIEKWPTAYYTALIMEASVVMAPFLNGYMEYLKEVTQQNMEWAVMAQCLAPVVHIVREEGFRDISIAEMLSLSNKEIWSWSDAILQWSNVEKNSVITCVQGGWRAIAPNFWQTIGQRGRVLMMMIDIPTLTYDRICALSPQELEVMVRDIAQPYFTRVERMGWLGAVVAVPATIISAMLGGM